MKRYSGGVEVPKHQTDNFTGITTDGGSVATVTLTYAPRSMNDIIIHIGWNGASKAFYATASSLTGRVFAIRVKRLMYLKAISTKTANSGAAGGDPHQHTMNTAGSSVYFGSYPMQAVPPIIVIYPL